MTLDEMRNLMHELLIARGPDVKLNEQLLALHDPLGERVRHNYTGDLTTANRLFDGPDGVMEYYKDISGPRKYIHIPSPVPNFWHGVVTIPWDGNNSMTADCWAFTEPLVLCCCFVRLKIEMLKRRIG